MKIILRFFGDWNTKQTALLDQNKIHINKKHDVAFIEIEESPENENLIKLIRSWKIDFENCFTHFSKSDRQNSKLFRFNGVKEIGYPQPEDSFQYINATYDAKEYCDSCGAGAVQNNNFRIAKEPKKSEQFFELNWVADEFFVSKELYQEVFKKRGITKMNVLINKTGNVSENYFQLKVPSLDISLTEYNFPIEKCLKCNRLKFIERQKGFFPGLKIQNIEYDIFKTKDWFGVGGRAYNLVFITKALYDDLIRQEIKISTLPVRHS